jgi:hypothetical protein
MVRLEQSPMMERTKAELEAISDIERMVGERYREIESSNKPSEYKTELLAAYERILARVHSFHVSWD